MTLTLKMLGEPDSPKYKIFKDGYSLNWFECENFKAYKIGTVANRVLLFLVKILTLIRLLAVVKISNEYHVFVNSSSLYQYFHTQKAQKTFHRTFSGIYYQAKKTTSTF